MAQILEAAPREMPKVEPQIFDDYTVYMGQLPRWKKPDDWEVRYVEKELQVPCGRHTTVGTLDCIVGWDNQDWHLQHKTLDGRVPLNIYAEQQRLDWHEIAYDAMMRHIGFHSAGTMLNILRKLTKRQVEENPESAYVTMFLPRSQSEVDEGMKDMSLIMEDIENQSLVRFGTGNYVERIRKIVKNRQACAGPYRNSLCQYIEVCAGREDIEGEGFVEIEERYPA